jgi:hypothetical protein
VFEIPAAFTAHAGEATSVQDAFNDILCNAPAFCISCCEPVVRLLDPEDLRVILDEQRIWFRVVEFT